MKICTFRLNSDKYLFILIPKSGRRRKEEATSAEERRENEIKKESRRTICVAATGDCAEWKQREGGGMSAARAKRFEISKQQKYVGKEAKGNIIFGRPPPPPPPQLFFFVYFSPKYLFLANLGKK